MKLSRCSERYKPRYPQRQSIKKPSLCSVLFRQKERDRHQQRDSPLSTGKTVAVQGYLARKKMPPPRTIVEATLHPTPYNPHPTPYTLHPTPYTLHPSPYSLHPTPYTPYPTPYTLSGPGQQHHRNTAGYQAIFGPKCAENPSPYP